MSGLCGSIATLMTSFSDLLLRSYFSLVVIPSEHSAGECWTSSSFQSTACFHAQRVSTHSHILFVGFLHYSYIRPNIQDLLVCLCVSGWLKFTACALLMFQQPNRHKHSNTITDTQDGMSQLGVLWLNCHESKWHLSALHDQEDSNHKNVSEICIFKGSAPHTWH